MPATARKSPFAPFRHPDFRLLWSATLISNFGALVQAVGAAWMMTQLTDSATLIALVQASNTLPIMLFALLSGALADILERRTLLLGAQVFMAAVSVLLAVLTWQGWMTPLLHLDVSTKLVQNLKLIDLLVGVGSEHMRRPRLPLVGAERERVQALVATALATRPTHCQSQP